MHHSLIEQYLAGPGQLRAALTGLDAKQLDARPTPCKWSIKEVICHIADYEPVNACAAGMGYERRGGAKG